MDRERQLRDLLLRAGAAHGEYETTVLNGVYDQEWYLWYARWVVEHGINALIRQAITEEQLSLLLRDLDREHKQSGSREHWADFYARRLAAQLG